MSDSPRTVSRRRRGLVVGLAALLACVTSSSSRAQDAPSDESGATAPAESSDTGSITSGSEPLTSVNSQLIAVSPFAGGLALPAKIGTSGARLRGKTATAASGTLDLGLLGELGLLAVVNSPTLTRLGIDTSGAPAYVALPRPVTADSRAEQQVDNRVALDEARVGPVVIGSGHETASAPEGGPAVSRIELGDITIDLGPARLILGGGVAESHATSTGASGTVAFGEIRFETIGNPLVILRGVQWQATQGIGAAPVASFNLGSAVIAGTPVPGPGLEVLASASALINATLTPLGLSLRLPTVTADGISPLTLELKDSVLAFQYINPVYSAALAAAVNQVEEAIVGGVPETGLVVTVANVVLAAATGRGGARVEIGGLTVSASRTEAETFDYAGGQFTPSVAAPVRSSPGPSGPSTASVGPGFPPLTPATTVPEAAEGPSVPSRPSTISAIVGEDLPGALVLALGAAAVAAAWLVDRKRITEWGNK